MKETLIGIAASILTCVALIPQLIKLIKEKDPGNVSMGMMLTLLAGIVLWIWYGFLRDDPVVIISNAVSLLINLMIVALCIKYKSEK